jgi:hypothetical protein
MSYTILALVACAAILIFLKIRGDRFAARQRREGQWDERGPKHLTDAPADFLNPWGPKNDAFARMQADILDESLERSRRREEAALTDSIRSPLPTVTRPAMMMAVAILGIANWRLPVFRFESYVANEFAMLLFLVLPSLAFFLFARALRGDIRVVTLTLVGLFAVGSGLCALLVLLTLPTSVGHADDPSFEVIQRVPVGASTVALYRIDCGAPCSFAIEARQERYLVRHSFKLVRVLAMWDPANEGEVTRLDDSRVRILTDHSDGNLPGRTDVWQIKPWVWF